MSRLTFQTGRPEDAEDLAQQSFIRLAAQVERGDDVGELAARLNWIAESLVINFWRDEERRKEIPVGLLPELDELALTAPMTYERADFTDRFDTAVRALPDEERGAFILTELRGLPVREAAPHLATSKSDVARRLQAARTFIREELT